jgi:hypothetical protein
VDFYLNKTKICNSALDLTNLLLISFGLWKMSHSMSDSENIAVGVGGTCYPSILVMHVHITCIVFSAAFIEAVLLQPTLYWKNARAQGLPFTMSPSYIYRGTFTSIVNEMQVLFAVCKLGDSPH